MTATTIVTSRFSVLAVVSLVLGLASLLLLLITGIPALLLGYYGLRSVNHSDGRLRGRWAAAGGMILGGLSCFVSLVLLGTLAVNRLGEKSRGAECKNNLRRIGVALNQFHDEHRSFPPGTVPNDALRPDQRLSWVALVLPFLESDVLPSPKASARRVGKERQLYAEIDFHQAWDAEANRAATSTRLPVCLCHSDGDPAAREGAWTTYVGIAGVGRDAARIPDFHPPLLALKDPNTGIFGYDRWTTRGDVVAGLAQRLMVVETMRENGPWAQGGPFTVRGIDPDDNPPIGYGRPFGGLHPKGAFVLFADGHADFVGDSIQPKTWQDMARISLEANARGEEP
jgi:prepilin-type processing-associated H-X9-DG protein